MFYVKEKISDGAEINIEITDENVFNQCPQCGKEVQVDIESLLKSENSDLFGTSVFCEECSKKFGTLKIN